MVHQADYAAVWGPMVQPVSHGLNHWKEGRNLKIYLQERLFFQSNELTPLQLQSRLSLGNLWVLQLINSAIVLKQFDHV